jgi:argininosuccinate lyase
VPFRIGHHYASDLTTYGRQHGKRPKDLSDQELLAIYEAAIGTELPVPVERIRQAMDPAAMVRERRGLGGPQPAEVRRMLAGHNEALGTELAWLEDARERLSRSGAQLDERLTDLQE